MAEVTDKPKRCTQVGCALYNAIMPHDHDMDETNKGLKMKRCSNCNQKKPDVKLVIDPYMEDVHEQRQKRNLCDECFDQRLADI